MSFPFTTPFISSLIRQAMAAGLRRAMPGRSRRSMRGFTGTGRRTVKRRLLNRVAKTFTLRVPFTVSSDGSGNLAQYGSLSNPDKALNGSTTYGDFDELKILFDSFKVRSVTLRWIPYRPNDPSGTTSYKPLYIVRDPDDSGSALASAAEALEYQGVRVKSLYHPWTVTFRAPTLGNTALAGGWQDIGSIQDVGAFKYIASGLTASTQYGQLILSMSVTCKNRR